MAYFDDFGFRTPPQLTGEGPLAFAELSEISGPELTLSKSARGEIIESLGLVSNLPPFPGSPPLLYLSQFKKGGLTAQISGILEAGGASSAARQKSAEGLSVAHIPASGTVARTSTPAVASVELGRGPSSLLSLGSSGPRMAAPDSLRMESEAH